MKIFLDDMRVPSSSWQLVKTPSEAINMIKENDVDILSLDHDLGIPFESGYDVVTWMEEKAFNDKNWNPPKKIWIHTSNSSAGLKMWSGLVNIQKFSKFPIEIDYVSGDNMWWTKEEKNAV